MNRRLFITLAAWLGVVCGFCITQAAGQGSEVIRLDRLAEARLDTPEFQLRSPVRSTGRGSRTDRWKEFSVPYRTAPDWLDEVSVTYYVLLELDERGPERFKLLTLSTTYVNVGRGRHRSTAYLHPTTLERFGRPSRWAAVVTTTVGGRPVEVASDEQPWWRQLKAEEGLLLNRNETPFAFLNLNDLEAIKTPAPRR